jgi:hypothetical protein
MAGKNCKLENCENNFGASDFFFARLAQNWSSLSDLNCRFLRGLDDLQNYLGQKNALLKLV